jgi:hypothetical protein
LALAAVLLAACGGQGGPQSQGAQVRSVSGLNLLVDSDAPFTGAQDFDARMRSTVEAALQYWGGNWAMVDQFTVHLVDAPSVVCGAGMSLGCFDGSEIRFTTRDPGVGTVSCLEQTVLVHEIGHLVIGDYDHTDPRWMEMGPLAVELSGRPGYAEGGTVACDVSASVWQHPLGTP